jgi:hypothetical protein
VIDESFETRKDGITVNHLSYPNIGRQHLNARLVCVASNTNLTPPSQKVVILDVNCKSSKCKTIDAKKFFCLFFSMNFKFYFNLNVFEVLFILYKKV